MKILALNGSPNSDGNTDSLIDAVGAAIGRPHDFEKIDVLETLQTAKWMPCTACSAPCNGCCFIGTEVEKVFDKMREADVIILASPVYFGTVSGILKCFWDKTRQLRGARALVGKKCAAIASGHAKFGGQETTIRALHDMALVQGMEIIADGSAEFDAGHHGVASSGDAREDGFAIQRCKVLANRIMQSI
ncbi:MAG: flavodoxin family protein [Oscillospiraceae bacterium]|nr:flavodoxin family protein [Oscillospiraceae bacterium]